MRRILQAVIVSCGLLGCDSQSDQAGQVTGPGIDIHCDAATPIGSTTVKVDCPRPPPS